MATKIISFTKSKLPYGWCGNMAGGYPIQYDDREWFTSEALFQALRFSGGLYRSIQEEIRAETSPMHAKKKAQEYRLLLIQDGYQFRGDQDVKNMDLCLDLKFDQHRILAQLLMHTEDATIIEDVSARAEGSNLYWGAVLARDSDPQHIRNWRGENTLGKRLMLKRTRLLAEPFKAREQIAVVQQASLF